MGWGQTHSSVSPGWATLTSPPFPISETSKISGGAREPWQRHRSSQPVPGKDSRGQEALQIFSHFLDLFGQNY